MKPFRVLILIAAVLLAARPAEATSITVLVGDQDWFGSGLPPGGPGPWQGWGYGVMDNRSAAEQAATSGAQLTDVYSALYWYGASSCAPNTARDPAIDPGCSPNGDMGSLIVPFSGELTSASIKILMGDFECTAWGAMTVDINGILIPFCFDDGFQGTATRTFTLTPSMIAAANLAGEIRMTFDHRAGYDQNNQWQGSLDYIAFDSFEINAEVVPEPATWTLLGLGLAALVVRRRLKRA